MKCYNASGLIYYFVWKFLCEVIMAMSLCKFDTFEDEFEMNQLIKSFQDKSIEYMSIQEPWEKTTKTPILDS